MSEPFEPSKRCQLGCRRGKVRNQVEATARKIAEDKARLEELGVRTHALEEEIEQPKPPLNQGWKGDVA
jgi:hypothetical protein